MEKLRDDLRNEGYATRTINGIVRIVGAVFKAAIRRSECALNPVERVERAFEAARELGSEEDHTTGEDEVSVDAALSPAEIRKIAGRSACGILSHSIYDCFRHGNALGRVARIALE
jgi:hypothetical protein